MITSEKKEEIVQYYSNLKIKNISKTAEEFDITRNSVYSILDEFGISRPSEVSENDVRDNENDEEMGNVQDIIDYYIDSDNKLNAIKELAGLYDVSIRQIITLLRKYNIITPKIISRTEVLDLETTINKIPKNIDLDEDVYEAVSIVKKFSDLDWGNVKGISRLVNLAEYIKARNGIDIFDMFVEYVERVIKNEESEQLKEDIRTIKRGESLNIHRSENSIVNEINETLMQFTREMICEKPEPEVEKPKPQPFLSESFFELLMAFKYPTYYKFLKMREKKEKQQELSQIKGKCIKA